MTSSGNQTSLISWVAPVALLAFAAGLSLWVASLVAETQQPNYNLHMSGARITLVGAIIWFTIMDAVVIAFAALAIRTKLRRRVPR